MSGHQPHLAHEINSTSALATAKPRQKCAMYGHVPAHVYRKKHSVMITVTRIELDLSEGVSSSGSGKTKSRLSLVPYGLERQRGRYDGVSATLLEKRNPCFKRSRTPYLDFVSLLNDIDYIEDHAL